MDSDDISSRQASYCARVARPKSPVVARRRWRRTVEVVLRIFAGGDDASATPSARCRLHPVPVFLLRVVIRQLYAHGTLNYGQDLGLRMCYRSGTVAKHCCIGVGQTLRIHALGGSTFLCEMTSQPSSWKCDVKSKIRLHQINRAFLSNFITIGRETTEA